ncbi:MAG: hypothetical protein U1E03_11380 [Hyphomonadaceae bacterium]
MVVAPISPPPKPANPLTLLITLMVALLGIGFYLHVALDTRELNVPIVRGRTIFDRLYGASFGAFWIYSGFRLLCHDTALGWARAEADQNDFWAKLFNRRSPARSEPERIRVWSRTSIAFSVMSFGIGVSVIAYEVGTLFFS